MCRCVLGANLGTTAHDSCRSAWPPPLRHRAGQIPAPLIERSDSLSGNELATYRSHAKLSADIVQRWSPPNVRIIDAILDHHEREQGQGFPRGLQGGGIDPDAKIIGLVDTYTALTLPPSSRPRLRPHEAIRDIVKTRTISFRRR